MLDKLLVPFDVADHFIIAKKHDLMHWFQDRRRRFEDFTNGARRQALDPILAASLFLVLFKNRRMHLRFGLKDADKVTFFDIAFPN